MTLQALCITMSPTRADALGSDCLDLAAHERRAALQPHVCGLYKLKYTDGYFGFVLFVKQNKDYICTPTQRLQLGFSHPLVGEDVDV